MRTVVVPFAPVFRIIKKKKINISELHKNIRGAHLKLERKKNILASEQKTWKNLKDYIAASSGDAGTI